MCVCVGVCPLTPQLLLPLHLSVQEGGLFKEVRDLGALLVLLGGVEHAELGVLSEKLTDGMDRKHDLLHAAVLSHDLKAGGQQSGEQVSLSGGSGGIVQI